MAWTTPRTWVAGETVTAALMNTHVRDQFNWLAGAGMTGWASYTPTVTGTSFALGNGTETGYYVQIAKTVIAYAKFVDGSTTTEGSGTWAFATPVSLSANVELFASSGQILDSGTTRYTNLAVERASATTVNVRQDNTLVGATVPMTWTTGDTIWFCYATEVA